MWFSNLREYHRAGKPRSFRYETYRIRIIGAGQSLDPRNQWTHVSIGSTKMSIEKHLEHYTYIEILGGHDTHGSQLISQCL